VADETNNGAASQSSGGQQGQAGAGAGSAGQSGGAGNGQQSSSQQTQTRPDWAPEAAWDAATGFKLDEFGKHFAEKINPILTAHAAETVRRNSLPQNPDAYQVGTSPAFKPPAGVEFKIDEADPLWPQAKAWAHKNGLSQEAFHEAIDLVAGRDVGTSARIIAARNAEIAKLGTTGPARIDAIERFYKGLYGNEADAKAEMSRVLTAADVTRHEKKIAKWATQGAAGFSQSHRVPGETAGKVSDEAYAKMSAGEKFNYTRQFDQTQFKSGKPS
jgi:hypothetical protein